MAATASLTLVKRFPYRGEQEEFSNTHHLDQVPQSASVWSSLTDTVMFLERAVFTDQTTYVRAVGHEPGNPAAVFEEDLLLKPGGPITGAIVVGGGDHPCPGDCAAWVRWTTTQRNSRGKPIYLRMYIHDVVQAANQRDYIATVQQQALQLYGNEWANGMLGGGVTFRRAGPNGAVAQAAEAGVWITTRTLERRGARRRRLPAGATVQLPPLVIDG